MEKAKGDLTGLLQLLKPQELQNMTVSELAGLLGLIDLLGILNLLQGEVSAQGKAGKTLQDALNAVLQGAEGQEGGVNPAELAGALGKNAALVNSLFNLLLSSKESKAKEKEVTESKPSEETQRASGRGR